MQNESSSTSGVVAHCSMLYSILPSAVRCRLPQIPSLQRYANPYSNRPSPPAEVGIETSSGKTSNCSSGSTTPDGEYMNALSLGVFNPTNYPSSVILHQNVQANNVQPEMDAARPEDGRDIDWKYAHQGLNLLSLAANESSNIQSRSANASFARQLYLHALAYLLRGLPKDLTMEEQLSIRSSLPPNIVEPLQVQVNGSGTTLPIERSLLHKTLASSIVQLFILFQFILPYFTYFLTTVYQYDREHKIIQRSFAQGMESLDQVGKSALALGSVVLEMGDGKVGQFVGEVTKWVVDGVAGGIQEGVGEVMLIVGAGKAQSLTKL